jgi:hypothetical protein
MNESFSPVAEQGPEGTVQESLSQAYESERAVRPEKPTGMRRKVLSALLAMTGVAAMEGCTIQVQHIDRQTLARSISDGITHAMHEASEQARGSVTNYHNDSDSYNYSASLGADSHGLKINESESQSHVDEGNMLGDRVFPNKHKK